MNQLRPRSKAILCIVLSAFFFALMNLFVRMAGDLPSIQKSFFRNLIAVSVALCVLLRSQEKFKFYPKNLPFLILRSTFGTIGILCNYYAVDHLLLSDASLLNKLSPFFAILLSAILLHEKPKAFQLFSVFIAFIGALFVIKPGFSMDVLPAFVGGLGGLSAGTAYTFVRKLSLRKERGPFIVFFFSAFSCLIALPFLIFDYHPMTLTQIGFLLLAGVAATGGQFTVTAAYSFAPASSVSVYDYTQILFAALLGFLFFQQIPDLWSIIGYTIICIVAIAMFLYNQKILRSTQTQ